MLKLLNKSTPSRFAGSDRLVANITWFEARDFGTKRNARLPTDVEGRLLVRRIPVYSANTNSRFAIGISKSAGASWLGTLDMIGNVCQWFNRLK